MRNPAPDRQMLMPAKQRRHRIDIRNIRRDDERRHRQPGLTLETHLAKQSADEAMSKVIHSALLAKPRR